MSNSKMHVNPDLQKERNGATIDTEELTCLIYGGAQVVAKRRKIEDAVYNDPDYKSLPLEFLSNEEQFEECTRRSVLTVKKRHALQNILENHEDVALYNLNVCPFNVMYGMNYLMFIPTIRSQGSEEQKAKWLPLALNHKILGTYAQTEIGHGTFIRGVETTAQYDPSTQEFIINSPTITSIKWWPGAMGKSSTHALVLAQLYTLGKCHGIHLFIVQLRSMSDHSSLQGITVGDIGPTFGGNMNDNGFLKLDNVRIPRENMLMKYAQVAQDGTYTKPPKAKLSYSTMTYVRTAIVTGTAQALGRAATIAVRYSAVRRQSELKPGEPQPQILSYPTQQHKLFPLIATAYAFHFAQATLKEMFQSVTEQVSKGDFSRSQELHALSSGLKAFTTWVANDGLEVLRMSCGGHGYSKASGFPFIYTEFTASCTYEGENTVLMLQTARYLLKCVRDGKSGKNIPGSVSYLTSINDFYKGNRDVMNLEFLVYLYKQRAYNYVYFAFGKLEAALKQGLDLVAAINSAAIFLVSAAKAHSHYFIAENMKETMKKLKVSPSLRKALDELTLLYALDGVEKSSGDFLQDHLLSGEEIKLVRQSVVDLLPVIRVNAVALVDAFDFRDELLNSVLGRYDGNVYENLYKWAQMSKLNKTDVHPTYKKYLRPFLKRSSSKL